MHPQAHLEFTRAKRDFDGRLEVMRPVRPGFGGRVQREAQAGPAVRQAFGGPGEELGVVETEGDDEVKGALLKNPRFQPSVNGTLVMAPKFDAADFLATASALAGFDPPNRHNYIIRLPAQIGREQAQTRPPVGYLRTDTAGAGF